MSVAPDALDAAFPTAEAAEPADGIPTLRLKREELLDAARRLRDEQGYVRFIDVTAVDDPDEDERFELQYLLYSMAGHRWVRLKVRTADAVPSVTPIFAGANWFER